MFKNKSKRIRALEKEVEELRKLAKIATLPDSKVRRVTFYECCENCMNNPKNNPAASGICNCTLPYFEEQNKRFPPQDIMSL